MGPAAHSRLGASSAKRWMTCPGSFVLSEQAPQPPTSVFAAAGTVAHELAEARLNKELGFGTVFELAGHQITVTDEMEAAVQVYLDAIKERHPGPGGVTQHETRVSLDEWFKPSEKPAAPLFGTADTYMLSARGDRLTIVDFKYGSGVYVPVQDNPQLLYYAAGVLASLPWSARYALSKVEIVVVQPRARGQEPVRSDVIDVLDLRLWIDTQLKPAVKRVAQVAAEIQAGNMPPDALATGTHCRFCAARPTCPAYADRAQAAARQDFPEDTPDLSGLSTEEASSVNDNTDDFAF